MNRSGAAPAQGAPVPLAMLVPSFFLGGTEGQAVELVRGLSGRYRVSVACIRREGPNLAALAQLGIDPIEIPLGGSLFRPNTGWQVWQLASELRRLGVKLVHAHDFYAALVAMPASRLARCKLVIGRLDMGHWPSGVRKALLDRVTAAADGVVVNAQAIRVMLTQTAGLLADRIRVIPNGIDVARFDRAARAPAAPLPELSGRTVVVHVANMAHPVKAQEDLLAAAASLRHDHPRLAVLLVGDGARRPGLERLAWSLGLRGRAFFLGRRLDVPALLKRAHAAVLCSTAEGLSNALIEYLAAGLPAVATRVGGNGEVVADGVSGLLVPPRQPLALARALERLAGDEALARRLGQAGRSFVERELTVEKLVERHDAYYRELLARA